MITIEDILRLLPKHYHTSGCPATGDDYWKCSDVIKAIAIWNKQLEEKKDGKDCKL